MKFKIKSAKTLTKPIDLPQTFWQWSDGLTQSFINQWLNCRESCRLRYIEGWKPRKKSAWFEFGTVFQYCLEQAFLDPTAHLPTQNNIIAWIKQYERQKNPNEILTSTETEYAEIIYSLAETMLPIYFRLRQKDFENEIIYNETEFDFISGENLRLRGKIDLGWKIKESGDMWLLDTKCLSVIQPEIIAGILPHDIQCMLYLYAALQEHKPKGMIYNIIRRPTQRRRIDEPINVFTSRIIDDVNNRQDYYFTRLYLEVMPEEVKNWFEKEFLQITNDIYHWSKAPKLFSYVNPNNLSNKYGKSQYFDLITKQDYTNYYQESKIFSELSK